MKIHYEQAADKLIAKKQRLPLHHILNFEGGAGSWDDQYWTITNDAGKRQTLPLHNVNTGKGHVSNFVPEKFRYTNTIRHLLMCYILEMRNKHGVKTHVYSLLFSARTLVARTDLFSIQQDTLNKLYKEDEEREWLKKAGQFITWCQEHEIVRKSLKIPKTSNKRGQTDELIAKRKRKMPDERAMWALCAIRNKVIPKFVPKGEYQQNIRDALIVCSATLAIGSPQRVAAEQFVLSKQTLQSKTVVFEDEEQEVHWMGWYGSKRFRANRKHFFEPAAPYVAQALNYLNEVGEPARVLCRFYEDPTQPLCDLIGNYNPKNLGGFDVTKPVNMFVLGYILGFYEGQKQEVIVSKQGVRFNDPDKPRKMIRELTWLDAISFATQSKVLLGSGLRSKCDDPKTNARFNGILTIAELQQRWIAYIKDKVPSFPYRIVGENKVKLSNALFIATGAQIASLCSGYSMGKGYFGIESFNLSHLMNHDLSSNRSDSETIFERHGFARDIRLRVNQVRHWSNTKLQESNISDDVIAMLSGRVDVDQNAVYDHSNESDKVARISRLYSKPKGPEQMKQEVRVIGVKEYQKATGKIATKTATGACTQELTVAPCTYLNDFVTQCTLCSSSCHFAHDEKAIDVLEKDLQVQRVRLEHIKNNERLSINTVLQEWFKTHHTNTEMLVQLIDLMKRDDIKIGTAIRYIKTSNVFRLTDLKECKVDNIKAILPDSKTELARLIESKSEPMQKYNTATEKLGKLFAELGITEKV